MNRSDREHIYQCLNGHPHDFRHLVQRYERVLQAYLAGRLGDRERAEEVAQEAFVRAYFNLGKLKKESAFYAWLTGIAERVVKEKAKAEAKERRVARMMHERRSSSPAFEVEKAIAKLSGPFREIILLRYYCGMSCPEIARSLGKPLGTVTKTLSRAYGMLREALREET
jgi:RNA polymerase sigma-70 factor (ECF subfamily)